MKNGLAMAAASAIPLLASGILAATGPGKSMLILNIALVLVELGWNFGLISGRAILVDSTHASEDVSFTLSFSNCSHLFSIFYNYRMMYAILWLKALRLVLGDYCQD